MRVAVDFPLTTGAGFAERFAGAVDSHAHVFGPAARFHFAPDSRYRPPDAPREAHLAMLDRLGFARGVLVQGSAHGLDNSAMLDALEAEPERLRGVAVVPAEASVRQPVRAARPPRARAALLQ